MKLVAQKNPTADVVYRVSDGVGEISRAPCWSALEIPSVLRIMK
jgi:hypothetical protein